MKEIFELYQHFLNFPYISTDSRNDVEGTIFFALSGENFNGNAFAESAIEKGAALAVIDDKEFERGDKYFLVNNTLDALQKLALHHRNQLSLPLIAITGSNGKTTTKELIASVLSTAYNISYTLGNLNNHIGVPLSLLNLRKSSDIAIIEMGANHVGEIKQLCLLANPDFGIITNIGKAHIEGFGSFGGVIKAKSELYDFIKSNQGELFVNADDELLMDLSGEIKRTTYGTFKIADITAQVKSNAPFLQIKWLYESEEYVCNTQLYGKYNLSNILAAIAVGLKFNVSPNKIKEGIESYLPENNRSQQIKTDTNHIILDAYNANPVSMKEAILSFKEFNPEKPWLILGDMFELGYISLDEHKNIIDLLINESFTNVILVGKDFFQFKGKHPFWSFENTEDAKKSLKSNPITNASVLIKGSRGMALEKLLEDL